VKKQNGGSGRNLNKLLDSIQSKGEDTATEKIKKLVKTTGESKKNTKTLEIPVDKPVAEKVRNNFLFCYLYFRCRILLLCPRPALSA